MVDVETARKKLLEALGEYKEKYWTNMKLWYKQKITKDDFDMQAFELLGPGKINYHNEFIMSILARCQALAAAPATPSTKPVQKATTKSVHLRKSRVKKAGNMSNNEIQGFESTDPLQSSSPFVSCDQDIRLCSQELVLPDVATLHGRLFLGAWDAGLDSITDDTAPLLSAAVEAHLKDILTACVSRRTSFSVREGGPFRHRFGVVHKRTYLRNEPMTMDSCTSESSRTYDQAEAEAYKTVAASDTTPNVLPPISLFDLRDTMQVNRHVIPSHTVLAGNMERTLADMWHPGQDEIKENKLYVSETRKLHEKLKQRCLRV